MSLVATYLAQAARRGDTVSEALAELNTDLRTSYSLSRLGEWRNGRRPIPPAVHRYLLRRVLEEAIRDHHGTPPREDADIDALAEALLPPPRK